MMDAYWLARILGPVFLIMGVWMLVRQDMLMKIWYSAKANPAILYLGGVLNLLIGFTVLSTYNMWSMSLAVLLPILGYLMVLRGLLVFFAHDWFIERATRYEPFSSKWAIFPLVFGVGLSWFAFL